jgi:restriction system-associated AAA family ATPase
LIAEIFQSAWHEHSAEEEREVADTTSSFELEYLASRGQAQDHAHVRLRRRKANRPHAIEAAVLEDGEWREVPIGSAEIRPLLPSVVVGYTSGDNETLSLPFFVSRSGYSEDVREAALPGGRKETVPDNRLLLIDYSTHLEVLVANLLLADNKLRQAIIEHANLDRLASFRCIVQLAHLPRLKVVGRGKSGRKGVQLTNELERYISALKGASTCWQIDETRERYIFDFLVTDETRKIFALHFENTFNLYKAFHKFALLNDLAIPKEARRRLQREIETRRFASRLPEPQDEEKIFRFEQVRFFREHENSIEDSLDYVSLSDGEHQQAEILGVFAMVLQNNALFILDEPESHFNPRWRVEFVKRVTQLPVGVSRQQEVLITSHAPFVPSDLSREQVHVFSKSEAGRVQVELPTIETYGATFDKILDHCFGVRPPISQLARDEIKRLMESGTSEELRFAVRTMGASYEKAFLADRLRELEMAGEQRD